MLGVAVFGGLARFSGARGVFCCLLQAVMTRACFLWCVCRLGGMACDLAWRGF